MGPGQNNGSSDSNNQRWELNGRKFLRDLAIVAAILLLARLKPRGSSSRRPDQSDKFPSPPPPIPPPPPLMKPLFPMPDLFAPQMLEAPKATLASQPPLAPLEEPVDGQLRDLIRHPSVGAVLGRRGSGKSALAYRILELQRVRSAPYVVGPASLKKLLPSWVGVVQDLDLVPHNSVVLVDEAYLQYHARNSMSEAGRGIGPLVNLSRQKNWSLIFVVQESRQLDINVISQLDWLAIKELTEISSSFERREIRRFTDKARLQFRAAQGDKRPWTWFYSEQANFEGLVRNELPTFWKSQLSRAFGVAESYLSPTRPEEAVRRGARLPRVELVRRAKAMRASRMSYGQIATTLGLSKSTVHQMVNEP